MMKKLLNYFGNYRNRSDGFYAYKTYFSSFVFFHLLTPSGLLWLLIKMLSFGFDGLGKISFQPTKRSDIDFILFFQYSEINWCCSLLLGSCFSQYAVLSWIISEFLYIIFDTWRYIFLRIIKKTQNIFEDQRSVFLKYILR